MNRFTNYAIRRVRDGTCTVFLEITGGRLLLQCKYSQKFVDVIPRCITPSFVDPKNVSNYMGRDPKGDIRKVFVEPYEVVCLKRNEVYCFIYSFGFKPYKSDEVIGVTKISGSDIL